MFAYPFASSARTKHKCADDAARTENSGTESLHTKHTQVSDLLLTSKSQQLQ
jgi:hypothetical protein